MKYQVSCDMAFASQAERDEVYAYLEGKRSLAFLLPGDFLTLENPVGGGYRVACTLRTAAEEDRDDVYDYLYGRKTDVLAGSSGFVEKHTCMHEEGEPCADQVSESWGEP